MRFKQPNPRSACPANSMKLRMGRPCACPIKGENTNAAMANRAIRNVTTTIGATTRVAPTASSPIAHLEGGVFSFFSIQGISRHAPSCGLQEIVARIHWPATVPRMRRCCGFWGAGNATAVGSEHRAEFGTRSGFGCGLSTCLSTRVSTHLSTRLSTCLSTQPNSPLTGERGRGYTPPNSRDS